MKNVCFLTFLTLNSLKHVPKRPQRGASILPVIALRFGHVSSSQTSLPRVIALPSPKARRIRQRSANVEPYIAKNIQRSLPRLPVSPDAIESIFGGNFDLQTGNTILRELQKRRVTGSLVDQGLVLESVKVGDESLNHALTWLRTNLPVDESAAAERFAEREVAKFEAGEEKTYIAKGIRWGLIHGDKEEAKRVIAGGDQFIDPQARKWKDRFDAAKRAGRIEEERQRDEQLAIEARVEELRTSRQVELDELREKAIQRREEMQKESQLDPEKLLDEKRSAFSRLFRPTMFGLSIVGLSIFLLNPANVVAPKSDKSEVRFEWTPAMRACTTITAVNLLVLCCWRMVPRTWWILQRYFMLSAGIPNTFSLVGALFSHQFLLTHFATNTAVLYAIGMPLYDEVGLQNFGSIYLGAGVCGALSALTWHVLRRNFIYVSLGSSGAVFGLLGAYCTVQSERILHLPFINRSIECSSSMAVTLLSLIIFLPMAYRPTWLVIDHINHLGGWIAGLLAGYHLQRKIENDSKGEESSLRQTETNHE